MSATTAKPNLFAAAKKTEKPSSTAKKAKLEVVLKDEDYPKISDGISRVIKRISENKEILATKKSEIEIDEGIVKPIGFGIFKDMFRDKKIRPESFCIVGDKGGKLMVLVIDKYAGVPDDTRAEELRELFGDEVVTTKTEFVFDNALLEKHMDAISEAIMSIPTMTDEEKASLFVREDKHSITGGSIERFMQYDEDKRDSFMNSIQPQIQLKNAR